MSDEVESETNAGAPEGGTDTRGSALRWGAVAAAMLAIVVCVWTVRELREPPPAAPDPGQVLQMEASVSLQSVADRVRAAWRQHDSPPTSLLGLPPDDENLAPPAGATADPPVDLWGHAYLLEFVGTPDSPALRLHSLGADGRPGGAGANADLSMDVERPLEQ